MVTHLTWSSPTCRAQTFGTKACTAGAAWRLGCPAHCSQSEQTSLPTSSTTLLASTTDLEAAPPSPPKARQQTATHSNALMFAATPGLTRQRCTRQGDPRRKEYCLSHSVGMPAEHSRGGRAGADPKRRCKVRRSSNPAPRGLSWGLMSTNLCDYFPISKFHPGDNAGRRGAHLRRWTSIDPLAEETHAIRSLPVSVALVRARYWQLTNGLPFPLHA